MLTRTCIRWLVRLTVLPVVAVAGAAACSDRPDLDAVVRVAIGEPDHLLPTDVNEPDGAQVLSALFAPLVDFDEQGRPYEVAASAIEPSEDGQVWTIRLREGFTFHDGEPVTAGNYLDAWNFGAYRPNEQRNNHLFARIDGYEALNPTGGDEPAATSLSGLAAVDDHTITVTLAEPFVEFRSMLGTPAFYPLPQAAFTAPGVLHDDFADAPVGNGPFRMVGGLEPGGRIELTRYEQYGGQPPRIGGVEFVVYPEPADAYAALLAGDVDLVTRVPADRLATVADDLDDRYLQAPAAGFQYLAVPAYQTELAHPDLRRAISMAIDRDGIVEAIFQDAQAPARSFVSPVVPGARAGTCGEACALDPTTARELYRQAGGPDRLTITYNADGGHRDWVEATCQQLRAHLGVTCVTQAEPDLTELLARVDQEEEVGLLRLGWVMDYPSMESYLGPVYTTTGSANFSGYRSAEFDQLVAAGAAASTVDEAIAVYQQAEEVLAQDLPVIPLRFGQHTLGYSPKVRDVTVASLGYVDLTRLEAIR